MGVVMAKEIMFITETGSEYVYDMDNQRIKRLPSVTGERLRGDEEWKRLLQPITPRVGESVAMFLEPLGYGDTTLRTTSRVDWVSPVFR